MMQLLAVVVAVVLVVFAGAGTVVVDKGTRDEYFRHAPVWFPDQESLISSRDMFRGPPNPYGFTTFQNITCDFVEPDPADPIGGTTPKFHCLYTQPDGSKLKLKIKYDQQYNPVYDWGNGNEEVYASVISQRLLWATGFGSDHTIPVQVTCRNCPIEPWTYIQVKQGYDSEDLASGWMSARLIDSGKYEMKVPELSLPSAVIYLKFDEYVNGDAIEYTTSANNETNTGFGWPELFSLAYEGTSSDDVSTQTIARDALTVIAALISHVDNFDGNQGFICLDTGVKASAQKTKSSCNGQPFAYIHDVGGTLGYGWKLTHLNFWPNYMDLKQWLEVSVWGDAKQCAVHVNGIPGCSWNGNQRVSEAGRALAARLLAQITNAQLHDLFTAARANLMRGDSVDDWISGFQAKLQKDVLQFQCAN